MLSPVSVDSSTALLPSITTPSTGMLSPGRTRNTSSFATCSIGTVISAPFLSTVAVFGASFIRLLSASVVLPFERASSIFPSVMRASIMAADSK